MRRWLLVMVFLVMAGCTSFSVLEQEFPKFKGKPVSNLVDRWGYPNAEQSIMGRKVYIWSTSGSYPSTTPTITTGYVGSVPVTITNTTLASTNQSCTVRVFVDAQDIVTAGDYDGNNGACFYFSDRLKGTR